MLALAVVACSLCLVLAIPATDNEIKIINKVRNPRLGGSYISKQLGKRDDTVFNIDLNEKNYVSSSSSIAVVSTFVATAVPIASTSIAAIASTTTTTTTTTPTTHYASPFKFTASLKDTNPLNDGLIYMASLSKKGMKKSKKSKKSLASAKSASIASKKGGKKLTGTAAATTATA